MPAVIGMTDRRSAQAMTGRTPREVAGASPLGWTQVLRIREPVGPIRRPGFDWPTESEARDQEALRR